MRRIKTYLVVAALTLFTGAALLAMSQPKKVSAQQIQALSCADSSGKPIACDDNAPCSGGSFFGFPTWYKYLKSQHYPDETTGQTSCVPKVSGLSDIWLIVAAVIDMLLRVAALVSIGFVVYGGITYTLSQGSPDKTKQALKTIISALVGLAISIAATALVTFLAGKF